MDFINVGFIGCGTHATNNIFPMLKYARCNLQAVCDLNEDLAKRNARVFGGKAVYTDAEKMLSDEKLDGVFIVGPSEMHHELSLKAIKKGIPVFVEKPPAPSLEAAEEMMRAAKAQGVILMTGFMKRHAMAYRKARNLITSGQFTPAAGFIKYAHWPIPEENLEGMLLGMSIHPIDLAISFFGDVASVTSAKSVTNGIISLALTIRFTSGKWAQLMLDSSQPRIQEHVEISGTMDGGNALIVVHNIQQMELHKMGRNGIDLSHDLYQINPDFSLEDISVWRPDYGIPNMGQNSAFFGGYGGEVREFIDAVIEKREPYPGTDDTVNAMKVIDAILQKPDGTTEL